MLTENDILEISNVYLNGVPVRCKFNFRDVKNEDKPSEPLRYCEAVKEVLNSSKRMLLDSECISCLTAKEILGLADCKGGKMDGCLKELVDKGAFQSKESAQKALSDVPWMIKKPKSITLSLDEEKPDVYLFYLRPKEFMRVVQAYQRVEGDELRLEISSVMPICGNCTVRPYVTKKIGVSFGCDESRRYGGIPEDKFVVGITPENIERIFQSLLGMEGQKLNTNDSE
jgi:uncharacterized protein (DUF169 family)